MARRIRLPRIPFFRIFYSTTYTSLFILELLLLAVTPTTLIFESIRQRAYQYIIITGGVYVLVVTIVLFIYTSRLYKNRTVLAAVGKSYIPVEEGDVSKKIRRLVKGQLDRSALIALECRPRNLSDNEGDLFGDLEVNNAMEVGRLIKVDPSKPPWGIIQHPGWSSPDPRETAVTPNVLFLQIIDELPNLLEARAVSLGGPPRSIVDGESGKTVYMGSRDYLTMLSTEGGFYVPELAEDFLGLYEVSKYSGTPVDEATFIALSSTFAEVLSGLKADEALPQPNGNANGTVHVSYERALGTIDDDGDSLSDARGPLSSSSDSGSEATVQQPTDTGTAASVRSPISDAVRQTSRNLQAVETAEIRATQSLSRRSSMNSLASARSVIQQAKRRRQSSTRQ